MFLHEVHGDRSSTLGSQNSRELVCAAHPEVSVVQEPRRQVSIFGCDWQQRDQQTRGQNEEVGMSQAPVQRVPAHHRKRDQHKHGRE